MIIKIKKWILGWWVGKLNNFIYIFEKNFTNLSIFYLFIFTVVWGVCNYKLHQLHIYNVKAQETLEYNEKYLTIKNFMNNCIEITHGVHAVNPKNILLLDKSLIKNKIDINLLYEIVEEKKKMKERIAIWEEDFDLWKKFKNQPRHHISNFNKNTELYGENKIEYIDLKKKKIKIFWGISLLVISDLILKKIII